MLYRTSIKSAADFLPSYLPIYTNAGRYILENTRNNNNNNLQEKHGLMVLGEF